MENLCDKFSFVEVLGKMQSIWPKLESDLTVRTQLEKLAPLHYLPDASAVVLLFQKMEDLFSRVSDGAMSEQDKLILLISKIHDKTFKEMRSERVFRSKTEDYEELKVALQEKATEEWADKNIQLSKGSRQLLALDEMSVDQNASPQNQNHQKHKSRGRGRVKGVSNPSNPPKTPQVQNPKGDAQQKFSASISCKFCQKRGHYDADCWVKFPEKRPSQKGKGGKGKGGKGKGGRGGYGGGSSSSNPSYTRPDFKFESELQAESSNKRARVNVLNSQKLWTIQASVNGNPVIALLDSGATISVVSRRFVTENFLSREESFLVQVASGQTVYTLGTTNLVIELGGNFCTQPAQVLDTTAFDAVLDMDFLAGNPRCSGIITQPQPARLIFDGQEFVLNSHKKWSSGQNCYCIKRVYKSEAYTLTSNVKEKALQKLGVQEKFFCDLFANQANAQEKLYCTRANGAFKYDWAKLSSFGKDFLWANPPFSQLERVITKVVHEPCKIVLVTPNWGNRSWKRILDKIALAQFCVPENDSLYETDRDKNPLPAPKWETTISLVDTTKFNVNECECDSNTLNWVKKTSKIGVRIP